MLRAIILLRRYKEQWLSYDIERTVKRYYVERLVAIPDMGTVPGICGDKTTNKG